MTACRPRWTTRAADGGTVHGGERVDVGGRRGVYVRPAMVEMPDQTARSSPRRPSRRSST